MALVAAVDLESLRVLADFQAILDFATAKRFIQFVYDSGNGKYVEVHNLVIDQFCAIIERLRTRSLTSFEIIAKGRDSAIGWTSAQL